MKKYKFQRIKLSALIALCTCLMSFTSNKQSIPYTQTDILVIGGGTSGTIAAIQAARIGCSTIPRTFPCMGQTDYQRNRLGISQRNR